MNTPLPRDLFPIINLSVSGFQTLNRHIYLGVNDRYFATWRIVSRIHIHVGRILTSIRTGRMEDVRYYSAMAFSWSMALANRLHMGKPINLDERIWNRFPGGCHYCGGRPCLGPSRCKKERTFTPLYPKPKSLHKFQEMFAEIYPHNTLGDAKTHLAEEACEVDEAFEHFDGEHNPNLFCDIEHELIDLLTFILAIANILKFDLAAEMEKLFFEGCPKCHLSECGCEYWKSKLR